MRLSNFLEPLTTREIHYNPRSHTQAERIGVIVKRAQEMGISNQIVRVPGRGYKLVLMGPRSKVMRSLNAHHLNTTVRRPSSGRRSSSGSRRTTTRRRNHH